MGLIALILLVVTVLPATGLVVGGLQLVREPSRAHGLGVTMLVVGSLWGLVGLVALAAVVEPLL